MLSQQNAIVVRETIEPPSLEPHLLVQNHGKIIAVAFINSGLMAGDKSRSKIRQKGGL